jgi:hypothetical protein
VSLRWSRQDPADEAPNARWEKAAGVVTAPKLENSVTPRGGVTYRGAYLGPVRLGCCSPKQNNGLSKLTNERKRPQAVQLPGGRGFAAASALGTASSIRRGADQ